MNDRLEVRLAGRVQGVGFRWHTLEQARALGLVGWVRNLPDGDVQTVAEGPRGELESFLAWLRRGPPHARVMSAVPTWSAATDEFTAFRIAG